MASFLRRRISQNRRRLVEGKFDLDLTYIHANIIAMGYPSDETLQGLIRNQIEKVSKYLKQRHSNCFKIYNLCTESTYDFTHFDNMVEMVPMEDHNAPCFSQIGEFCASVHAWLSEKAENVAIVHCKAGKGRTGTMISCYFLYSAHCSDPFAAMYEFSTKRCLDSKGVTIPSQRRYIEYYADFVRRRCAYQPTVLYLKSVLIRVPEKKSSHFPHVLKLHVFEYRVKKLFDSSHVRINKNDRSFVFQFEPALALVNDIKFTLVSFKKPNMYAKDERSCQGKIEVDSSGCWRWLLTKKDIDLAFKNPNFHEDLSIEFTFESEERRSSATPSSRTMSALSSCNMATTPVHVTERNSDSSQVESGRVEENLLEHLVPVKNSSEAPTVQKEQAAAFDMALNNKEQHMLTTKKNGIFSIFKTPFFRSTSLPDSSTNPVVVADASEIDTHAATKTKKLATASAIELCHNGNKLYQKRKFNMNTLRLIFKKRT